MGMHKAELANAVQSMTHEGCRSALQFLIGFNLFAASEAVEFVKNHYPDEFEESSVMQEPLVERMYPID